MKRIVSSILLLVPLAATHAADVAASRMARYNVVWNSPSKDASGEMPIGNGDIAAGVYAIEDDALYLLLAKNDAFNYAGEIYKTGRVRVDISPNPFAAGKPFRQTLDLATGSIVIEADGLTLRIWADANRNVFHVEIHAPSSVHVTASPDLWDRLDATKDVHSQQDSCVFWYFPVGDRSVYADDLAYYEVQHMAAKFADPYRYNTFGNLLEEPRMEAMCGTLVGKNTTIDLRIHALAMQTPNPHTWVDTIRKQAARPIDVAGDWAAHCRWWADFWDRGWVISSDNTLPPEVRERFQGEPAPGGVREEEDGAALVAQSYNIFRYLMACQSRGRIQAKFNGGLFTQPLHLKDKGKKGRPGAEQLADGTWLTHPDDRLWGRRFTYQNQRLLYWPLLASGDFDLMRPFFAYYWNLLPMRTAITRAWFGHEGAYYRENIEPTGAERDCGKDGRPPKTKPGEKYDGWYHDYYFTSGLETTAMMLDYVGYTGDAEFRDRVLVPFARQVLRFYDQHYARGADGKLWLDPSQVIETWWIAVNPATDIAGLRFCLDGLLALRAGTAEDQSRWQKFRGEIPAVPLHAIDGRPAIAPAEIWEKKHNAENGELYPVFPFRCFGVGLGSGDIASWTVEHRTVKDAFGNGCWTQDQIHWAYAGRADEASAGLVRRFRIASPMCRFPMYGREGPDSCPDFDHFGSGAVALQRMLVQEADRKILLLPAWPAAWDADFKLHAGGNAVITGQVQGGKLLHWEITPEVRKADVVVGTPQVAPARPQIPANGYPLRAGADQQGHNRFRGQIGRVTMFRRRLAPAQVAALAGGDRTRPVRDPDVAGCWMNPRAGDALPTQPQDFAGDVSLEAWILPGEKESGRVLDKITVGKGDGILFDTFPDLSLRLIVGPRHIQHAHVLQPGQWQHVAVVLSRGVARVYLAGKVLP